MAFPLTITGTLSVPRGHRRVFSQQNTIEFLANVFENDRWTYYDVKGDEIHFRNKKVLVNAWSNPFGAANRGTINVSVRNGEMSVKYTLSMTFMLCLSFCLSIFLILPSMLNAGNVIHLNRLIIPGLAWVWLFGGCYVFTGYKFRKYLKDLLSRNLRAEADGCPTKE